MAGKPARRPRKPGEPPASPPLVKKTIRLSDVTAKRLGVESVMTGEAESAIVERVLAAYLEGWRLPSKIGGMTPPPPDASARSEDAA